MFPSGQSDCTRGECAKFSRPAPSDPSRLTSLISGSCKTPVKPTLKSPHHNLPRVNDDMGFSDGCFGPLASLETPALVEDFGLRLTGKAGLLGRA